MPTGAFSPSGARSALPRNHFALWRIWLCAATTFHRSGVRPSASIVFSISRNPPSAPLKTMYNIERLGDDRYQISLAVAGFSPEEISVTAEHNVVTIEGSKPEKAEREYLYRRTRPVPVWESRPQKAPGSHPAVAPEKLENPVLVSRSARKIFGCSRRRSPTPERGCEPPLALPRETELATIRRWRVRASSHAAAGRAATAGMVVFRGDRTMEWAAKALAGATGTDKDIEEVKAVAIFCGAGLLLSLSAAMVFPDLWSALF